MCGINHKRATSSFNRLLKLSIICLVLLCTGTIYGAQFTHYTGSVALKVDEEYLGGFSYHNIGTGTFDNLWRFFISISFGSTCRLLFYGQAHDEGELASSSFLLTDSLVHTIHDSFPDTSRVVYQDTSSYIKVTQTVISGHSGEYYIDMYLTIENISEDTLKGGRLLLFYEGDIPEGDYYDDSAGRDTVYNCVYQYDYYDSIWTGFLTKPATFELDEDMRLYYGNYVNWYENGRSRLELVEIINNPFWQDSLVNTDCAVYQLITLPDEICPGQVVGPMEFSLLAGVDLERVKVIAGQATTIEEEETEKKKPGMVLAPNPCYRGFQVKATQPGTIYIYDITGRLIYQKRLSTSEYIDTGDFPAGLLLYRIKTNRVQRTGKIIHIK